MFSAQKVFTSFILISYLSSNFVASVFAEGELLHSLDELPSTRTEASIKKTPITPKTSDDDFGAVIAKKAEYEQESTPKTIEGSALITDRETYIASHESKGASFLTDGFITNPFVSTDFSAGLLSDFFSDTGVSSTNSWKLHSRHQVSGVAGTITVGLEPGTMITTMDGQQVDASVLSTTVLDTSKRTKAQKKYEKTMKNRGNIKKGVANANPQGFEFGIPGKHLIFSEPVKISIDTPNMSDRNVVDLLTMHAGDADFNTSGLSVNASTACNPDGTATIPGSQTNVQDGKVTFYTCGASSFTMNTSGGTTGSNDLRVIVGDYGQIQIYYNNLTQIYSGNPATTGGGLPAVWPSLRIGGTTYGNAVGGLSATAWSTATTTGSTNGNTYTATTTLTRVVGGRTYTLILNWSHTAPNKYITLSYQVIIPTGNTANVRFYMANDSAVAGSDANDVGYVSSTGGLTVGIYDNVANIISAYRYISGPAWTAHEVSPYTTIGSRISGGTDFTNTVQTTAGDLGFGVDWNFGITPGTYAGTLQWTLTPYVANAVPDLIPGIGQPEGPLAVGMLSQLPITISNVGNANSSGLIATTFTLPTNITGPGAAFSDNGWSCGAQVGTTVTCTKNTSITGPTGVDTFRIPVTPSIAASGTTVTFNMSMSNTSDSNTSNNTAFATNSVVGGVPTAAPGGVVPPTLWLKANDGPNCASAGCNLTAWNDKSGNGRHFSTIAGTPTLNTNALNFNPVIHFDGVSALSRVGALNIGTTYIVYRHTSTRIWENPFTNNNGNGIFHGSDSNLLYSTTWTPAATLGGAHYLNAKGIATNSMVRPTGFAIQTRTLTANDTSASTYIIGRDRTFTDRSITGDIAEIITYAGTPTTTNRAQVESYLAIKYGITLDQSTPTNYLLAGGGLAWNATLAGIFNKNIAGIARDDVSALNQNRSQSIANTSDIIVSKTAIASNKLSLLWSNDGGSPAALSITDAPTGYQRIPREWLFQEKNGDIGTITVSYPVAALPTGFTGTLMMLVDPDMNFASGATAYTGTLNGSNWDFSLNIADMSYATFGKAIPTDATPPTINAISFASGTLFPRGDFSLTATYSDTGVGIQPNSFSGKIYAWDAIGATWSTTNLASSYMSVTSATTSTGVLSIAGLPYGKYRVDISVADTLGNTTTQSYTYFVDAIEWTVSADTYNIGNIVQNVATFGTGELIITVKTVGAGFSLTTTPVSMLANPSATPISYWSGTWGVGYDIWSGGAFGGTILTYSPNATLASVNKNINQNGQKNTYTYRVKYGAKADFLQEAGDYQGTVSFGLALDY